MIKATLTPDQLEEKRAELKTTEGITLVGNGGTYEGHGVRLTYSYDGSALTVNVDSAPPFMKGHVEGVIRKWLGVI
jgi:hypothetical protein